MRFLLSWHASRCNPSLTASTTDDNQALSSLDYTCAVLNADLAESRTIVLRPPNIFVWLGVITPNTYWLLHKALARCKDIHLHRSGFTSTTGPDLHLQQVGIYIYIAWTRSGFTSTFTGRDLHLPSKS
eukprot:3780379-Amphidinium_carterae.1